MARELTASDRWTFNEGTHHRLYEVLGAHVAPDHTSFRVWAPNARQVSVIGDFNNWNTSATPLRLDDSGWHASVDLDADRAYHYRYLIDGSEWHNDWQADCYEPNEYGGDNSVVITSGFLIGTRRRIVSSAD